jgi:hypothetical protein
METIALPSGATALLRDPQSVTERARRPISRLQSRLAAGPVGDLLRRKGTLSDDEFESESLKLLATDDWDLLDQIADNLIVALVASWSHPVAPSLDSVLDLPTPDYEALKEATAKYQGALMPDFEPSPDAESPTQPSGD